MSAPLRFLSLLLLASACLGAAGPLQAATRAAVYDSRTLSDAFTCSLPSGWEGGGSVVRDENAASPVNQCVRTMQLLKKKEDMTAHYLSAWEVPLKKRNPTAAELADALLPAVSLLPGYTIHRQVASQLSPAPKEVQELRLGRDRLRESLGEHISGRVYVLTATFLATKEAKGRSSWHNVAVGAVVHERTIRTGFRTVTAVAFHDITIIGGPLLPAPLSSGDAAPAAPGLEKAMEELAGIAQSVQYNRRWMHNYLRDTALAYDSMPKVDEEALPELAARAERALKLGFPAVVATMRAVYEPVRGD